jgi:hypothetical protein
LVGVAILIKIMKNSFNKYFSKSWLSKNAEWISASAILAVGLVYFVKNVFLE